MSTPGHAEDPHAPTNPSGRTCRSEVQKDPGIDSHRADAQMQAIAEPGSGPVCSAGFSPCLRKRAEARTTNAKLYHYPEPEG
jgi:hypothetical protein